MSKSSPPPLKLFCSPSGLRRLPSEARHMIFCEEAVCVKYIVKYCVKGPKRPSKPLIVHENWKRLVGKSTKDSGQMHEEWWVDTRKENGG